MCHDFFVYMWTETGVAEAQNHSHRKYLQIRREAMQIYRAGRGTERANSLQMKEAQACAWMDE